MSKERYNCHTNCGGSKTFSYYVFKNNIEASLISNRSVPTSSHKVTLVKWNMFLIFPTIMIDMRVYYLYRIITGVARGKRNCSITPQTLTNVPELFVALL